MSEPGAATNAIPQINQNGLPSLNSFPSFNPTGGDGPSIVYDGRTTGGLGSINPLNSSTEVDQEQNGTRKVRGQKVENEGDFKDLDQVDKHKIMQESPYVHYIQKPGSNGEIFTPFIKPVDSRCLGRQRPLENIRYNDHNLITQKPPASWRLGLSNSDFITPLVEKKIVYRDTAPIRFN